jgi:hypothetical protein
MLLIFRVFVLQTSPTTYISIWSQWKQIWNVSISQVSEISFYINQTGQCCGDEVYLYAKLNQTRISYELITSGPRPPPKSYNYHTTDFSNFTAFYTMLLLKLTYRCYINWTYELWIHGHKAAPPKIHCFAIYYFLHFTLTYFPILNVPLSNLFLDIISFCYSHKIRDQVVHPYTTTVNNIPWEWHIKFKWGRE